VTVRLTVNGAETSDRSPGGRSPHPPTIWADRTPNVPRGQGEAYFGPERSFGWLSGGEFFGRFRHRSHADPAASVPPRAVRGLDGRSPAPTSALPQIPVASCPARLERRRTRRATMPRRLTRFFGRETEIERLTTMLQDGQTRLVTLTGPGGSGKTSLALETVRRLWTSPASVGSRWCPCRCRRLRGSSRIQSPGPRWARSRSNCARARWCRRRRRQRPPGDAARRSFGSLFSIRCESSGKNTWPRKSAARLPTGTRITSWRWRRAPSPS
jgi:hypothetical protein